jgi:hypothetical protein
MAWKHGHACRHVPLEQAIIQNKAKDVFSDMKANKGESAN